MEAWIAFPAPGEKEEIPTPTRIVSWRELTSNLPDEVRQGSREGDEPRERQRLREMCGPVKVAREVMARAFGPAGILAADGRRAVRFDARRDIPESFLCHGVPSSPSDSGTNTTGRGATAVRRPPRIRDPSREFRSADRHAPRCGVVTPTSGSTEERFPQYGRHGR